jgi:hypothetical protein
MKLSEAILLGSTQIRLDPLIWLSHPREFTENCGCVIGMGLSAIGYDGTHVDFGAWGSAELWEPLEEALRRWPWLSAPVPEGDEIRKKLVLGYLEMVRCVDECHQLRYLDAISCLAWELYTGRTTLEAVVDWVSAHEPEESAADEGVRDESCDHGRAAEVGAGRL